MAKLDVKVKPNVLASIKKNAELSSETNEAIKQRDISVDVVRTLETECEESVGYKVYVTTNYDIFKKLEANRDATAYNAIIKSIKEIGYVDNPIIVNENLEIIDGQNRLEAFRKMELPVPFHMVYGIGINEARTMNIFNTVWKLKDFVKSNSMSNKFGNEESFMKLETFHNMFNTSYKVLVSISRKEISSGKGQNKIFKDGTYVMTNEEEEILNNTLPWLSKLKPKFDSVYGNKARRYTAFAFCYNVDGVDKDRLFQVADRSVQTFIDYPSPEMYLKQISDAYNRNLKSTPKQMFELSYIQKMAMD